ncbi:MAG: ParA family protein [Acidobacteria bacterium]|nr:ParA family protein [Acidobacteriota bacterium]
MRYVVFNRKGGVGKSTLVVNLAAVAAEQGLRTLIVDLDPQGNATQYLLGRDAAAAQPAAADFFDETLGFRLLSTDPHRFVHATAFDDLHLIPAGAELGELQSKLESRYKIFKLRELLDRLGEDFDRVFLDTPPALGFYTMSALIAADRCLIPFDCDEFSRRALYQLLGTVREIREDHNPGLEIGGVVVNLFQEQAKLPRQLVDELRAEGLPILEPFVNHSVKVRESHREHRPLVHLAPSHKLSQQLRELHQVLESRAPAAT